MALGYIMIYHEDHLMKLPPFHFLWNLFVLNIHNHFILNGEPLEVPGGSSLFLIFWMMFMTMRQLVLHRSWKSIEGDQEKYEIVWEALANDPASVQPIADLQVESDNLVSRYLAPNHTFKFLTWLQRPLQHVVVPDQSLSQLSFLPEKFMQAFPHNRTSFLLQNLLQPKNTFFHSLVGAQEDKLPWTVQSLDQLYMHAAILFPIFQRRVQTLAASASGLFLARATETTVHDDGMERIPDKLGTDGAELRTSSKAAPADDGNIATWDGNYRTGTRFKVVRGTRYVEAGDWNCAGKLKSLDR